VRAALGEVIVKEILRRIKQAELADSQNDWSQASSILKRVLSEIPESHDQVANLLQSYYEQGTQAEAQGNWEIAVTAFNKVLDVLSKHQQAQTHKNAIREKAIKECISKAHGFESRKNYQAGLALLDRYKTYFPDDERLSAEYGRLAEASKREQAQLAAAAAERKLQNQIDACTQQLNGHFYAEAAQSVSDLISNDSPDSRIRSLAARAAQEIPPKSYENHEQAERVIWSVQRLTPDSVLASPESGVRIDWHGNFETKTIDNWYMVRSSHGQFIFKGSPATVALTPNQAVRVIGTIQGVERIGTLGPQPQQMVVVHAERID
jgi:tetratricopeptide (TPR) repeat protein